MANSAFGHEPSFTTPGSTTDNAVIRWDGTSGGGQLNSGIIIDDSNVITGVTSLTVDNLLINGNTISSTAGTDLLITPLGGQQLILDGTIIIDAGVVTGATSITSTEFVGGGVGLTALNGTQITSGTLPAARIAVDSIVEAKLQSGEGGGLTWAAAGATAPLQLASGSAGTPTYGFSSDVDTGLYMISAGTLGFSIGGTERVRINSNGGLFINETTHANAGGGCIISKAGNNNDVHFALKGSGTTIDHGMTTLPNQNTDCEVDDYFIMQPSHNLHGGVYMLCLAEDTPNALVLETIAQGQDTSRSTSTSGFVTFNLRMHDGSNGNYSSSMSSEAAGFVIKRDGVAQYIFNMSATAYADTGWSTFSDGRLKLNQAEVPYGLATVMQMQPKIYDKHSGSFDDDGNVVLSETKQRMLGFVAQEIKALAPELVTDINEDDSFYGLDNGRIVPILVKAIQELNAKVDALTE